MRPEDVKRVFQNSAEDLVEWTSKGTRNSSAANYKYLKAPFPRLKSAVAFCCFWIAMVCLLTLFLMNTLLRLLSSVSLAHVWKRLNRHSNSAVILESCFNRFSVEGDYSVVTKECVKIRGFCGCSKVEFTAGVLTFVSYCQRSRHCPWAEWWWSCRCLQEHCEWSVQWYQGMSILNWCNRFSSLPAQQNV